MYKKKQKRREEKRKREKVWNRCWVHLNYHLLKTVLWEVEGASATPPSPSRLEATTPMWSKLTAACQTPNMQLR